jgi:hypothetical protein
MARMVVAAALAVLVLGGCGDRAFDVGVAGLVSGDTLNETPNNPVRRMSGTKTAYPNLSTVPDRPTDLTTEQARAAQMQALEKTRAANRAAGKALQDDLRLVEPAAVPPPPNLSR